MTAYVQMKETFFKNIMFEYPFSYKERLTKMSGWSEEGSCNFEFWLPKIFMTEGESPSCWPHFAQTDNSREQLTAHHVKFLVCYPNYAYLPPSISDLKAHGMKCHHVEHVGNMLPFVFFPEVTSVNLFFVLRQLLCSCDFMWTCSQPKLATKLDLSQLTVSSPCNKQQVQPTQNLPGRDAGTKGTGKCSDIWLHDQCLCEMQSDGCLKSQRFVWDGLFLFFHGQKTLI